MRADQKGKTWLCCRDEMSLAPYLSYERSYTGGSARGLKRLAVKVICVSRALRVRVKRVQPCVSKFDALKDPRTS